jgi:hypothetical protein
MSAVAPPIDAVPSRQPTSVSRFRTAVIFSLHESSAVDAGFGIGYASILAPLTEYG